LKDALTRWIAIGVSGTVTLELRRGDDYSILDTKADCSAYDPQKLSMENVASAFSPEDRIGALEMQTLSVTDNRTYLRHVVETARKLRAEPGAAIAELVGGDEK